MRQIVEAELVCPCGAENVPSRPPVIRIEADNDTTAGCSVCGRYGPVLAFMRPETTV